MEAAPASISVATPVETVDGDASSELCDHCQLPLPQPWWTRRSNSTGSRDEPVGPRYCCFGCRMAAAVAHERTEEGAARHTLTRLGLAIFFSMNVMAFTMTLWSVDVYEVGSTQLSETLHGLFRYLVMLFSIPVFFLLGIPLWENAREGLKRGVFSTDLLLAAGVAASFVYSAASVFRGSGPVYFEVGCVVLVMVTLGRWFEATGKLKASDTLDRLAKLMPERVRRVVGGVESEVELATVVCGDQLRVLAGERIPADGRIDRGTAYVDEQVLTGESRPVLRHEGDPVLGGTLNLDGDLHIEVTAPGAEGTLARLIELVREARRAKGAYEKLADRISSWFVPVITAVALLTFLGHTYLSGLERGLLQGLAVVLIACPCALGLATPLAVWSALGRAAGAQVLFRSGDAFERLAGVRAIRFDKTGTLTTGEPTLASFTHDSEDPSGTDVLRRARALASSSSHLLSRSLLHASELQALGAPGSVSDVRVFSGRGISAEVDDEQGEARTFLGSRRLLEENGQVAGPRLDAAAAAAEHASRSIAWIGWGGHARGLFEFEERLRPNVAETLDHCRRLGLNVAVLTGDHAARGEALARELNVPVKAGLLPEDKVEAIEAARVRFGPVAMVGDGVNDAPALATSDLGVALGTGTDLSRESAAVCLLGDDLERLPWAIDLARQTVQTIQLNLFWAFGYNTVGVACAAIGWLSPALAAFLMVGSSAFVIVNSLRLRDPGSQASSQHEPTPTPLQSPAPEALPS